MHTFFFSRPMLTGFCSFAFVCLVEANAEPGKCRILDEGHFATPATSIFSFGFLPLAAQFYDDQVADT